VREEVEGKRETMLFTGPTSAENRPLFFASANPAARGSFGKICWTNRSIVIGFEARTREQIRAGTAEDQYDGDPGAI